MRAFCVVPTDALAAVYTNVRQFRCALPLSFDGRIDSVAELLERNLLRSSKRGSPRVLTTRREALALYRHVLRWSNIFVWKDDQGRPWRDVIRHSARKEFEDARFEQDPQLINRMLITGRDCVDKAVENFMRKRDRLQAEGQPQDTPMM
jgi:hypothetical protein